MTNLQGLIFDMDGTLVDSAADIAASVNFTLSRLGLPEKPAKEVMGYIGDGMKTLLERATGNKDEKYLAHAIEIFHPQYLDRCTVKTTLYPGVKETLEHFKRLPLGLVTNKPLAMTEKILRYFEIDKYFKTVVGGESTPKKKPDPEPVLKALSDMAVPASSALMVGDGLPDMEAGRRAGVKTCAVTYGYRSREDLEKLNLNYMIDHLKELKDLDLWR